MLVVEIGESWFKTNKELPKFLNFHPFKAEVQKTAGTQPFPNAPCHRERQTLSSNLPAPMVYRKLIIMDYQLTETSSHVNGKFYRWN